MEDREALTFTRRGIPVARFVDVESAVEDRPAFINRMKATPRAAVVGLRSAHSLKPMMTDDGPDDTRC